MKSSVVEIQTEELTKEMLEIFKDASSAVISSPEQYEFSTEFLIKIKEGKKKVTDTLDPIRKATYHAYQEAMRAIKKHMEPLERAEKVTKAKRFEYRQIEEKQRQAEQDRLNKLAEKEAAKAAKAQKKQNPKAPPPPPAAPVVVESAIPKAEGTSIRKDYKYKVIDLNKVPRKHMIINDKQVSGIVRSMKMETDIPGIEVYEVEVESVRGR